MKRQAGKKHIVLSLPSTFRMDPLRVGSYYSSNIFLPFHELLLLKYDEESELPSWDIWFVCPYALALRTKGSPFH